MDTGVRIDKWLWAARFFRARSLAQAAVEHGRVLIGGERVKPSRVVRLDDRVTVRIGDTERTVTVLGLEERRGPATAAQALYQETADSLAGREARRQARGVFAEPAETITGRPTKRDRRQLGKLRED